MPDRYALPYNTMAAANAVMVLIIGLLKVPFDRALKAPESFS